MDLAGRRVRDSTTMHFGYRGKEYGPKEHDARGSHTVHVSKAKEASVVAEEQDGDTDVKAALAALAEESGIDLEETDVQETLLAYKESRRLRGDQRVNCGYRPVNRAVGNPTELRVDSTSKS